MGPPPDDELSGSVSRSQTREKGGARMPSLVSLVLTGLAFLGAGLLLCRVPGRPRHRPPSTLSPPSAARPFTPLPPLKAGRGREARLSRRGGRIDRL